MKKNTKSRKINLTKKSKITLKQKRAKDTSKIKEKNNKKTTKITFRIERFTQGKNMLPIIQSYDVEVSHGDTILDCLDRIREEQDPSLTYRRNCRNTICGSCAMTVNNRAYLACKEHALEMAKGGVIHIAPMRNMPVVKDIVTDMNPFWKNLRSIKPWLDTGEQVLPEKEFLVTPQQQAEIKQPGDCIMCGACYAASNGVEGEEKFLGPATLARAYRFIADPRDSKTKERIAQVDTKHGVWDCTHCFYCNEVCPVGVEPMDQILKIRKEAIEQGSTKTRGARHHLAFVDIIRKTGILNENKLPIQSVGGLFNIFGMLEITPVGLRMMTHGKMPPLIHHNLPDVKEIQEIFAHYKGKEKHTKKQEEGVQFGSG